MKRERCVIRKGSVTENVYLQRDGTWGEYRTARRFYSQNAAEKAGTALGIDDYGIFP